jgi:hypothetical protein
VLSHLSATNRGDLVGHSFFPHLISSPFHSGLKSAFLFGVVVLLIAAAASWSRGARFVADESMAKTPTQVSARAPASPEEAALGQLA